MGTISEPIRMVEKPHDGRHGQAVASRPKNKREVTKSAGIQFIPENDGGAGVRLK